MAELDRVVAGLRCRDVLALLPHYLDGDLDPEALAQVRAHLDGCDTCEKFGAEYGALVAQLRRGQRPAVVNDEVRARIVERLERYWGEELPPSEG